MERFIVNGRVNSRYIDDKVFVTNKEALKYIDYLCTKYDLQVEKMCYNRVVVWKSM